MTIAPRLFAQTVSDRTAAHTLGSCGVLKLKPFHRLDPSRCSVRRNDADCPPRRCCPRCKRPVPQRIRPARPAFTSLRCQMSLEAGLRSIPFRTLCSMAPAPIENCPARDNDDIRARDSPLRSRSPPSGNTPPPMYSARRSKRCPHCAPAVQWWNPSSSTTVSTPTAAGAGAGSIRSVPVPTGVPPTNETAVRRLFARGAGVAPAGPRSTSRERHGVARCEDARSSAPAFRCRHPEHAGSFGRCRPS